MAPAIASLAPKKMSATRKIRSHLLLAVLCNYSCLFYKVFILIKKERVPHSQRQQRLRKDFRMIRRVLFSTLCVRPPLGDPAAVKKHAFAPKRFRKRRCITAHFVRLKRGSKHEFISGARPLIPSRAVSERGRRGGKQCRAFMRTLFPAFIRRAS